MSYLKHGASRRRTPQREQIPDRPEQVQNSEDGYVWKLDPMAQMRRFLILGAKGGTFYVSQRKLVKENADVVRAALAAHGIRAVDEIVGVSMSGRAPRNDEALWALAIAAGDKDRAVRDRALRAVPQVARTGTHLFQFVSYVSDQRGWGRQLKAAVAAWYQREDVEQLGYQMTKYRERVNWSHKGVLQHAHPKPPTPTHDALYAWATGSLDAPGLALARHPGLAASGERVRLPASVEAYERAKLADTPAETAALVLEYGGKLPREALRTDHLTSPEVWRALLEAGMPMTALMRNLANMTRAGVLKPLDPMVQMVCEQLTDGERLRKARVHPLSILFALTTYQSGHGFRGGHTWQPVSDIVGALDEAFYKAFGLVVPANKRFLLGLDVSGSMGHPIADSNLTCMGAAVAMAMVTHRTEQASYAMAFDHGIQPITLTRQQRLDDVLSSLPRNYGGTDCSLPMQWALQNKIEADVFSVFTDNETYAGSIHPAQALEQYRQQMGIDAKLIVVGMTSNGFSIADPFDAGMLDVVGFDTSAPAIMSAFARGEV